jgi:hypothetical protein
MDVQEQEQGLWASSQESLLAILISEASALASVLASSCVDMRTIGMGVKVEAEMEVEGWPSRAGPGPASVECDS